MKNQVEVDTYSDGKDVVNRLLKKKEPLDILLLDIDMPKSVSGLEVAEQLRKGGDETLIIFLTAHDQYVFASIEHQPYRYIRKNFMQKELPIALSAAFGVIAAKADREITVKTDDENRRILLSEVMYYEVFGRKVVIYLKNGAEIVTKKTIKEMLELIPDDKFIMLHRNSVVNADYVKSINDCVIILKDEQELIISRPRLKEVKQQLLKLWGELL
jgi:DNA-binding LytR/AlgR family response regulator